MDSTYVAPVHSAPAELAPYIEQMSQKERELHELAIKLLGSSYFIEYSHGYLKWLSKQAKA